VFKAKELSPKIPLPSEVQNKGDANQGNKDKTQAKPKQKTAVGASALSDLTGIGA
jgi:hypothetical protein